MRRLAMLLMLALVAGAAPAAAAPPTAIARIHGTITKIDPMRHTFWIHRQPFALMPMAMTSVVPWPGTKIRPAK